MIITAQYCIDHAGSLQFNYGAYIEGCTLIAVGERTSLRNQYPDTPCIHLDNAVLMPGLINPHCHLELDWCKGKTRFDGSFVDWLQSIRDLKKNSPDALPQPLESLNEMIANGITTLVDHHNMPNLRFDVIRKCGIRYFGLKELFHFNQPDPSLEEMLNEIVYSFAPHATYTCSPERAKLSKQWADQMGRCISTHISEIKEEYDFIHDGVNEDIKQLSLEANTWDENWKGTGLSPVGFYDSLGVLGENTYAIHVNYNYDNDIAILKRSGCTIVYCPRSHKYFKHPKHPIQDYIRYGINVTIGTDSLASNDCLNLFAEIETLLEAFPKFPLNYVFDMITINAAKPLRLGFPIGTIINGAIADIAIFPVQNQHDGFSSIFKELIDTKPQTLITMVNGKIIRNTSSD